MSLQKSSPWMMSWTCREKTLESRWARVVLPAEEGPEIPNKNTGRLSDAVGWLVGGSVETVGIMFSLYVYPYLGKTLMINNMKHSGKSRERG